MKKILVIICVLVILFSSYAVSEEKWKGGPCYDANGACKKLNADNYGAVNTKIKEEFFKDHPSWSTGFTSDPRWKPNNDAWSAADAVCDKKYDDCLAAGGSSSSSIPSVDLKPVPSKPTYSSPATSMVGCNTRYNACIDWANTKQLACLDNLEARYGACAASSGTDCLKIKQDRNLKCDKPELVDQDNCKKEVQECNKPFQKDVQQDSTEETDCNPYKTCLVSVVDGYELCASQGRSGCVDKHIEATSICNQYFPDCVGVVDLPELTQEEVDQAAIDDAERLRDFFEPDKLEEALDDIDGADIDEDLARIEDFFNLEEDAEQIPCSREEGYIQYGDEQIGDTCLAGKLTAYFCDEKSYSSKDIRCKHGCDGNQCRIEKEDIPSGACEDKDGLDVSRQDKVFVGGRPLWIDLCKSDRILQEGLCVNNEIVIQDIDCSDYGYPCSFGACAEPGWGIGRFFASFGRSLGELISGTRVDQDLGGGLVHAGYIITRPVQRIEEK